MTEKDYSLVVQQKSIAVEQLNALGRFWIGSDIYLEQKVIVPAKGQIDTNIIINKQNLPDIDINRGSMGMLHWSVRSFLAQSGIEPIFDPQYLTDVALAAINHRENTEIQIRLYNHGYRSVEIEGGLMRFFYVDDSKRLIGDNLRKAIGTDLIIEGIEGTDWNLGGIDFGEEIFDKMFVDSYEGEKDALCVKLFLSDKKYFILPDDKPVQIKSRRELPTVLVEIPQNLRDLSFQIGETPKVKLGADIIGVINIGGFPGGSRHIRSPLIDSNFEGIIRTEILHGLNHIELFIYKKA